MSPPERQEAAAVLRTLLAAVESGELTAAGPAGARLQRRIEGAISALEADAAATLPSE